MNDRHSLLAVVIGALGLVAGVVAALADLPAFAVVAGVAAFVAGLCALLVERAPTSSMTGTRPEAAGAAATAAADSERMRQDIAELENALATQVQGRISAEEAVRSLGEQLATAQRESATTAASPAARQSLNADALMDPNSGLFSEEYFRVAIDARIAAARRHLRPVGVVILEVIEGLRSESPKTAPVEVVAEVVNATFREADTACRMADGRFALVLEDTSENGAIWTVERIRRTLNERLQNVTLRAGIACYPAHAFSAGELLTRSDEALVSARDWQQDRIEVATVE